MDAHRSSGSFLVVPRLERETSDQEEQDSPEKRRGWPDGLLPVLIVLAVSVVPLASAARQGVWNDEDTLALVFALIAGFLATQYLPFGRHAESGHSES
jgi:hypothetical protein